MKKKNSNGLKYFDFNFFKKGAQERTTIVT